MLLKNVTCNLVKIARRLLRIKFRLYFRINNETIDIQLLRKEIEAQKQPMTLMQYHERIKQSIEDSKNGNVIDVYDLLSEIEKWG